MSVNQFPQPFAYQHLSNLNCWGTASLDNFTRGIQTLERARALTESRRDWIVNSAHAGLTEHLAQAFDQHMEALAQNGWKGVASTALYHSLQDCPDLQETLLLRFPEARNESPEKVVAAFVQNCMP